MKYKNESLFSKYDISPSKSMNELRVIFQTDPNKRKDLPIVIKTISSPLALLEEELFYIRESSDVEILNTHSTLLTTLAELKEKVTITKVKQLVSALLKFYENKVEWSQFNYYKTVGASKAEGVILEFVSMVMDELEHLFINSIGTLSTKLSVDFYDLLRKCINAIPSENGRITRINDELIEFAGKLNSLESKSDDVESKLLFLISICKNTNNSELKEILKITTKKLSDNLEINGLTLLNCYPTLISLYSSQDVVNFSGFLNTLANMYLDLKGKSKYSVAVTIEILTKLDSALAEYARVISWNNVTDKNFDKDELSFIRALVSYFVARGKDWLTQYRRMISSVENNCTADNIYNLVKHVFASKPVKDVKRVFTNIILEISDFQLILAFIFECHKEVNENPGIAKACDPKEVDRFIAKYYWVAYTSDEFNKTLFDNIRGIGFDVMARANTLTKTLTPYSDNWTRQRVRDQIISILNTIPRDWFMEDKRVEKVISDFGGTCTSDVSTSAKYIDLYDELFTGSSNDKHGLKAYNNRYRSSSSSSYRPSSSPSSSYSSPSSSGGCYVATAVYGSYDCPEVWLLRRYRDYYLDKNFFGRLFIKIYYAISPTLVKWFGKSKWFKKLIKPILEKKIKKLKELGYSDTEYDDKY